ncbi:hypothetical protein SLEP1_g26186 [Rubroshorea leprosula]|uniref:Uncharacterized protein n=1 Tax=Rubroshorea leprosula TaxID=152421 RepID=A0AAV5JUX6_9ROSI|nr:hypothetical protein SLEP1_g26186 [Rubroshorea leprosula]
MSPLRILSLNPENPGAALLFSLVRQLLCGFEFLGIFRSVSFPADAAGFFSLPSPVLAGKFWFLIVLSV